MLTPVVSCEGDEHAVCAFNQALALSSQSKTSEHGKLTPDKRGKNFPFCGILSGDPDVEVNEEVGRTGCYDVGVPEVDGIYELRSWKEPGVESSVQHLLTPGFLKSGLGGGVLIAMQAKFLSALDDERIEAGCGQGGSVFRATSSPAMQLIEARVADIALMDIPVLILGETGTGKDVLARRLHAQSRRSDGPFVKVRCSSLRPGDLDRVVAEIRDGGTLLLDEVAEFGLDCQARALESLFEGSENPTNRLGVISTSSQDLGALMNAGRLRQDVYYRLSGVSLRLPPLRNRQEDIVPIAEFFLDRYSKLYERPRPHLNPAFALRLREYSWPGNIRELENAMKRVVALGEDGAVFADSTERPAGSGSLAGTGTHSLKQAARAASRRAERELILEVLSRTRWNRKRAAEELQISYKALLYKLKQIGLEESAS